MRVLVFSCTHFPYAHKDTVKFLKQVKKEYRCNQVVCLGDLFDYHCLSNYQKEADVTFSAESEHAHALEQAKELYGAFPKVLCTTSNHDLRPFRAAASLGMSQRFLKNYAEILNAPKGWEFREEFFIQNVSYSHGERAKSMIPHLYLAKVKFRSAVIGHYHTKCCIDYYCNDVSRIFGMAVGCLINNDAMVFRYNKSHACKPVIGCGVVINGVEPHVITMNLGSRIKIK